MAKKTADPNIPKWQKGGMRVNYHAPDFTVVVIYRDDSFVRVRGPGPLSINPFVERLGEEISIKPRAYPLMVKNVLTRDPISITLVGKVAFTFDPREGDATAIARLVKIPEPDLTNALGDTLQEFIFKALRARVNEYWFEEIQRGATLAELEEYALASLRELPSLRAFGISNIGVLLTHAILPQEIEMRLKEAAQRRYNAQVSGELEQTALLRSLIVELVEKVNREGNLEQLFNFTEAVNALRQIEGAASPATKIISGEVDIVPDEPALPAPPPSKPAPKPKTKRAKKSISPSYLDPDV
ncbi:MAG: hypothetical protein EYC68_03005 [Chloroflexota bacterium]|nr:MAG: hypothetical protein EYC68_03005 [Chloroflexota bacterium]